MSKYVTALNGKEYLMDYVITWNMDRLKRNFDSKFRDKVVAKVKATISKKHKDPEWLVAKRAKREATIAAKKAENPNWDKERESKWKRTLAKSKKWQKFLKDKDTRYHPGRKELLAKDPDYYKKRTAKFLATQKANGGHWTKRKPKAD